MSEKAIKNQPKKKINQGDIMAIISMHWFGV